MKKLFFLAIASAILLSCSSESSDQSTTETPESCNIDSVSTVPSETDSTITTDTIQADTLK